MLTSYPASWSSSKEVGQVRIRVPANAPRLLFRLHEPALIARWRRARARFELLRPPGGRPSSLTLASALSPVNIMDRESQIFMRFRIARIGMQAARGASKNSLHHPAGTRRRTYAGRSGCSTTSIKLVCLVLGQDYPGTQGSTTRSERGEKRIWLQRCRGSFLPPPHGEPHCRG